MHVSLPRVFRGRFLQQTVRACSTNTTHWCTCHERRVAWGGSGGTRGTTLARVPSVAAVAAITRMFLVVVLMAEPPSTVSRRQEVLDGGAEGVWGQWVTLNVLIHIGPTRARCSFVVKSQAHVRGLSPCQRGRAATALFYVAFGALCCSGAACTCSVLLQQLLLIAGTVLMFLLLLCGLFRAPPVIVWVRSTHQLHVIDKLASQREMR